MRASGSGELCRLVKLNLSGLCSGSGNRLRYRGGSRLLYRSRSRLLNRNGSRCRSGLRNRCRLINRNRSRLLSLNGLLNRSGSRLLIHGLLTLNRLLIHRLTLNGLLILRSLREQRLICLRLKSSVVVRVQTCVLTNSENCFICNSEDKVAEYKVNKQVNYTGIAGKNDRRNALEYKEDGSCVVCDLHKRKRNEALTVGKLIELGDICTLSLCIEYRHIEHDSNNNCSDESDQKNKKRCESCAVEVIEV